MKQFWTNKKINKNAQRHQSNLLMCNFIGFCIVEMCSYFLVAVFNKPNIIWLFFYYLTEHDLTKTSLNPVICSIAATKLTHHSFML